MTWFSVNNVVLPVVVYLWFGGVALCVWLAGCGVSIVEYEVVNYIEHYGLSRQKTPRGIYEQVKPEHSWNAPQRITNYVMFKLQRHSDHHSNSLKSYQTLVSYDQAPQLPQSYIIMILCAFVPSFWFDLMDPYTKEYNQHHKVTPALLQHSQLKIQGFILKVFLFLAAMAALGQWV